MSSDGGAHGVTDPDTRVTCPHATSCPGCALIALPYGEQLSVKRGAVERARARYPETSGVSVSQVVGAEPVTGYRQRTKLVVADDRVGLYARGSHTVVDLPQCRVLDPELAEIVAAVRELLPGGPKVTGLDLRRTDEGPLATLIVSDVTRDDEVRAAAERLAAAAPRIAGVAVSLRDERSPQLLGRTPVVHGGVDRARCRLREGGPYHYATHGAFAQAHAAQQRALAAALLRAVDSRRSVKGANVLELFAGSGALSLELAARGARVHAVESFEPAARLAREAATEQGLTVIAEAADATAAAQRFVASGRRFDAVIVNPPRRGLTPELRAALGALAPPVLVYVSCEPETLARDLADLARKGLSAASLEPWDMMPLTEEVESLAVLVPKEAPAPEVLFRDDGLLAVAKAAHEPVTPQGEQDGSLLDRVKRLDGAERATPVHRLDIGTSGVVVFALEPEHVPALSRALAEGEKEYVALVRGVVRDKGSIRRPLVERGRPLDARTRYVRRDIVGGHSFVTVRPDEGRKHQIRRHFAAIGHALVGDERYGHPPTNLHFGAKYFLDRGFLHCARLAIAHRGSTLELTAPLAPDLAFVLERLRTSRGND